MQSVVGARRGCHRAQRWPRQQVFVRFILGCYYLSHRNIDTISLARDRIDRVEDTSLVAGISVIDDVRAMRGGVWESASSSGVDLVSGGGLGVSIVRHGSTNEHSPATQRCHGDEWSGGGLIGQTGMERNLPGAPVLTSKPAETCTRWRSGP